jgi:hypothetical protein
MVLKELLFKANRKPKATAKTDEKAGLNLAPTFPLLCPRKTSFCGSKRFTVSILAY